MKMSMEPGVSSVFREPKFLKFWFTLRFAFWVSSCWKLRNTSKKWRELQQTFCWQHPNVMRVSEQGKDKTKWKQTVTSCQRALASGTGARGQCHSTRGLSGHRESPLSPSKPSNQGPQRSLMKPSSQGLQFQWSVFEKEELLNIF